MFISANLNAKCPTLQRDSLVCSVFLRDYLWVFLNALIEHNSHLLLHSVGAVKPSETD